MTTIIARGKKEWFRGWQAVTLLADAIYTTCAANVADIYYVGDYDNLVVIIDKSASGVAAGDTLEIVLDGSWDGVNFYNMGESSAMAGNVNVIVEMMQFRKGGIVADEDAILSLTADAGAGVTRPSMCPPFLRITYTLTDGGGADTTHTFGIIAYVQ